MHIDKMHVKLEYHLSNGMRGHTLPFAKIKISKYMILLLSV